MFGEIFQKLSRSFCLYARVTFDQFQAMSFTYLRSKAVKFFKQFAVWEVASWNIGFKMKVWVSELAGRTNRAANKGYKSWCNSAFDRFYFFLKYSDPISSKSKWPYSMNFKTIEVLKIYYTLYVNKLGLSNIFNRNLYLLVLTIDTWLRLKLQRHEGLYRVPRTTCRRHGHYVKAAFARYSSALELVSPACSHLRSHRAIR